MNAGDIVQIRQTDGVDHWIYAKVLDPVTRLVLVQHPGNRDHDKQQIVAAQDIRTKADVQALLSTAQGMAAAQLTPAQVNTLAANDGWFKKFKQPEQSQAVNSLHTRIAQHYQAQVDRLT
ncbi:MAG: hypothetical protein LAO20_14295 [Acidobacteriia bacterium]|nr:hypothetical protein [Terriglobia bacterium]